MESFTELELSEQVLSNLETMEYRLPTEVQAKAIPVILEKKDLVIQSHTGSGKTAAFGLPLIQNVMADVPAVQFLVLAPTRELAAQIRDEFERLAKDTGVKVCAIYGGADMGAQIKKLRDGAQIVIGTPGRILDHLKRRTMSFSVVRAAVLDEADKMLSMGFLPDVQLIFNHLPKRRQVVMSSATFPYSIEQLIHQYMVEPVKLLLSSDDMAPKEIDHMYCSVQNADKEQVLLALLEKEQPELSLIFCNTRADVKTVHYFLANAGLGVEGLSSDLSQSQRERVLSRLKAGQVQHVVCTDLAARGIDVPALSHVFLYSASGDAETYVHRTGRTGRAGKSGKAISLVSSLDLAGFRQGLKVNGLEAEEIGPPTEEDIVQARIARFLKRLEDIGFAKDVDIREEFVGVAERLTADQAKSLLPFLLEQFARAEAANRYPREELPAVDKDAGERRESGSSEREYGGRGRDGRRPGGDRGGRRRRGGRDGHEGRGGRGGRGGHQDSRRDGHGDGGRGGRGDGPRRQDERPPRRHREAARKSKSFTTVCLGLGRLDGVDEMDIQNILRRQGRARMEDIGDIAMKEHESYINIGELSLENVLGADGKHFKNHEIFIDKSPIALEPVSRR